MSYMFNNIGGKIKTVAVVIFILGIVGSVLYGSIVALAGDNGKSILIGLLLEKKHK